MTTPEEYKDLTEAIKQLQEENARLQTTMIAAAEEIQEHWKAHCDEDGYGPANLMHRLEKGVSSGYPGYNAGQFTKMEEENQRLKEALKGLMTNPSINLGDQIYVVRDHEGKGWNGPNVRAWSDAVKEATKLIEP